MEHTAHRDPSHSITEALYLQNRDRVLSMSTARQRMEGQEMARALTDREIAQELGLSEDQVREIRCLAELDGIDMGWYQEADEFKRVRAGRSRR